MQETTVALLLKKKSYTSKHVPGLTILFRYRHFQQFVKIQCHYSVIQAKCVM